MKRRKINTQMFALAQPPPAVLQLACGRYGLVRVFKHDFFAATCLYQRLDGAEFPKVAGGGGCEHGHANGSVAMPPSRRLDGPQRAEPPKVVVKFERAQPFCGLPLDWLGKALSDHEEAIYRTIAGIRGVPRWVQRIDRTSYAIEYIEGRPLDHPPGPPPGFFDRLAEIFQAIHGRGVAYCDGNKRSNILVSQAGEPFLVDYQISIRRRDDWPWPLRAIAAAAVRYMADRDLYFLCKHKRRLARQELTPQEEALSRHLTGLHLLHSKLAKPYRALRRRFLQGQYEKDRLISPTAELEDHYQPEKDAWRKKAD